MKRISLFLFTLSFGFSGFSQAKTAYDTHAEAIQQVLKVAYVEGVFNEGNAANVELGFADKFKLFSLSTEGKLEIVTKQDWINRVKQNKAKGHYPPTADNFVRIKIINIDIEDYAAMVKLQFYRGDKLAYIDFIGLYRFKEGWKIVSKTFVDK